jgi:hypothetical protein
MIIYDKNGFPVEYIEGGLLSNYLPIRPVQKIIRFAIHGNIKQTLEHRKYRKIAEKKIFEDLNISSNSHVRDV